jgi:hypothetical protein
MATVAFGTTAPEGSVTWPRRVPVAVAPDWAEMGVATPISVAKTRIVAIRLEECFNLHLVLSWRIRRIQVWLQRVHDSASEHFVPRVFLRRPSWHGESHALADRMSMDSDCFTAESPRLLRQVLRATTGRAERMRFDWAQPSEWRPRRRVR